MQTEALTEGKVRQAKKPKSKVKPKKAPPKVGTSSPLVPVLPDSRDKVIDFAFNNSKNFPEICQDVAVALSKKNPELFLILAEEVKASLKRSPAATLVDEKANERFATFATFAISTGHPNYFITKITFSEEELYEIALLVTNPNRFIAGIKHIRSLRGCVLKEAKMIADFIRDCPPGSQYLKSLTLSGKDIIL